MEWRCAKTLEELCELPSIAQLKAVFYECGWKRVSTGFTPGGDTVSFTLRDMEHKMQDDSNTIAFHMALALACHGNQIHLEESFQGEGLLANYSIEKLCEILGVAIVDLKWKRNSSVRVLLCPRATCNDKLSGFTMWRYSPVYSRFFAPDFSLVPELLQYLWEDIARQNYMVNTDWKHKVEQVLIKYFDSCIADSGPSETISLPFQIDPFYMWGAAGVGKSTFIQAFAAAMERCLRSTLNPCLQVNIVKVPLNSVTPEHLDCILRVQGISDWSVERLVEQSIVRGNIVILHLEENPPPQEQMRLYRLIRNMLDKQLFRKYPEYIGNVIVAFTSNYPPHDEIGTCCVSKVSSPNAEEQFQWAIRLLKDQLPPDIHIGTIDISLPRYCSDMRPLNNWWRTLAWHAMKDHQPGTVDIGDGFIMKNGTKTTLKTSDGFFFTTELKGILETVIEMGAAGFLRPAVAFLNPQHELSIALNLMSDQHVVLKNLGLLVSNSDKYKIYGDPSEIRGGIFKFIDDLNNPNSTHQCRECIHCGPGKLCLQKNKVVVVTACINETGQFMLRELLETSDRSSTHRFSISKKRVIFLLQSTSDLTPQAISRAHFIGDNYMNELNIK